MNFSFFLYNFANNFNINHMNDTQQEILDIIASIWKTNPFLRYRQVLTGLNILEFADKASPEASNHNLRDIFSDTDNNVLKRIKTSKLYLNHEK